MQEVCMAPGDKPAQELGPGKSAPGCGWKKREAEAAVLGSSFSGWASLSADRHLHPERGWLGWWLPTRDPRYTPSCVSVSLTLSSCWWNPSRDPYFLLRRVLTSSWDTSLCLSRFLGLSVKALQLYPPISIISGKPGLHHFFK